MDGNSCCLHETDAIVAHGILMNDTVQESSFKNPKPAQKVKTIEIAEFFLLEISNNAHICNLMLCAGTSGVSFLCFVGNILHISH